MIQRYASGKQKRSYFVCPTPGCGVIIRRDGASATKRIREHKQSHP